MRVKPHVELLRHTYNPEELVAMAARLCYSKLTVDKLQEKIAAAQQDEFIERLVKMGHESAFEHISFTFAVEGVSRALLAQITRHRIASFSVQSQRYVGYENELNYVLPPRIENLGPEAIKKFDDQMNLIHQWYLEWKEALGNCGEAANEDARFVLPNATETRFIFTMNYRELKHFLGLRMCNRAQWEIREIRYENYVIMFLLFYLSGLAQIVYAALVLREKNLAARPQKLDKSYYIGQKPMSNKTQ